MKILQLIIVVLLAGCAATSVRAPVGDYSQRPRISPDYHDVRTGDTLYSVAFLYGYSVEEVAQWNDLRPPYTIYSGQKLRVKPPPEAKPVARQQPQASQPKPRVSAVRPSQPKVAPSQPRPAVSLPRVSPSQPKTVTGGPPWADVAPSRPKLPGSASAPAPMPVPAPAPVAERPAPTRQAAVQPAAPIGQERAFPARVLWAWPVEGRLIRTFDAAGTGKKGINIAGKNGESVRSAAAGKVVYAGSGLAGYGRLIIIKHNNDFLSAYAHNRKLIATEGQWVNKGEVIAQMGSSGTDRTQLHFEIRKNGRPVDPLDYLPKR